MLKNFAIGKIEDLKTLDGDFAPDQTLLETLERNESNWFSENVLEVTLEIDRSIEDYFLRKKFLPNFEIIEETEKKLIITTKLSYEAEALSIVKSWIPHIRILSPVALQEKLEAMLRDYIV